MPFPLEEFPECLDSFIALGISTSRYICVLQAGVPSGKMFLICIKGYVWQCSICLKVRMKVCKNLTAVLCVSKSVHFILSIQDLRALIVTTSYIVISTQPYSHCSYLMATAKQASTLMCTYKSLLLCAFRMGAIVCRGDVGTGWVSMGKEMFLRAINETYRRFDPQMNISIYSCKRYSK